MTARTDGDTGYLAAAGARGGAVTLLGQLIAMLTRTVAVIVLARLIAPESFGLVAIVLAIASFATDVIFGIPMATVQADSLSRPAMSAMFLVNSGLGLVLAVAMFFSADAVGAVYGDDRLVEVVRWLALLPALNGVATQSRVQMLRTFRFSILIATEAVALVAGSLVAVAMALGGAEIEAVVAQSVVPLVLQVVSVVIAARWVPGRPGAWAEVKGLLAIGFRIFSSNVLRNASRSVIVPVTALSVPAVALGNFDRAQQLIVSPVNLTVDQLQRVAVPVLSQLRRQPSRMLAYMQRAQLLGAYGTATLLLLVAALGEPLVRLVLGPGWGTAGTAIQILAFGATCRVLGQTMQWIFIAADATAAGLRFSLWAQPLVAMVSLAGLPWGVLGVAVMSSVAWALYWPAATVTAARAAGFPTWSLFVGPARALLLFGLPVGVGAAVPRLLGLTDWLTIALGLLVGAAVGLLVRSIWATVRGDLQALVAVARMAVGRRPLGETHQLTG